MQLNEAVRIVQQKLNAEMNGQTDGEELDAYQDAFKRFPVLMEVATHCVSDQIIQANYEARRQAAMAQARKDDGNAPAGFSLPGMPGASAPVGSTPENK